MKLIALDAMAPTMLKIAAKDVTAIVIMTQTAYNNSV